MANITPVGIDLGTTLSASALVAPDGSTRMISNAEGDLLTPSAVLFDDLQTVVGRAAWDRAATHFDRVAQNAKRDMGQQEFHRTIRGRRYPPEVIQACILRKLRADVVAAVGEDFAAVITAPAYFGQAQRKTTADAGVISGMRVLNIVNEPTAAALAFGEKLGYLSNTGAPSQSMRLLVYDLGGGTFDVTIIELSAGRVQTLSTDGDVQLGGWDWDLRLARYAEQQFRREYPAAVEFSEQQQIALSRAAQHAKHELSVNSRTVMRFKAYGQQLELPITRELFEQLTSDLLERTCFTTRQTLEAAGITWHDIDRVVLVGGSTRMTAVTAAVERMSGMKPSTVISPDEAVARGAAIFAQHCLSTQGVASTAGELKITDVISHSLGIEGLNLKTTQRENVTLIPRNTSVPYSVARRFITRVDNQRSVKIQLLEGESSLPSQCTPLGVAAIRNLPPGLPKGTPVEVKYAFDVNGRVSVKASVPGHGAGALIEMERMPGLGDDNLAGWKEVVCRDGGYQDMEQAISALAPDAQASPIPPVPKFHLNVPNSAPHAASKRLKDANRKRRTRGK